MNYFELFDLPVSLIVDHNQLSEQYDALQNKYATGSPGNVDAGEQTGMQENSALVKEGYEILQDPDRTIKYVLEIKGLYAEGEKYELPAGFVKEMEDLDKELKESDILDVEEAETKVFQFQKSMYHEVQNIMEGYSDDIITEGQLLQVKDYYYRKKYLEGILERLKGMRNIAG